jgi:hypothetical protein
MPETWDGPQERTDSIDKQAIKNLSQSYYKVFANDSLNQRQVSLDFSSETGIVIGTLFPGQSDISCVGIETSEINESAAEKKCWRVVTKWSNAIDNSGFANAGGGGPSHPQTFRQQKGKKPEDRSTDPLARTVDVYFRGATNDHIANYDATGKAYANVVGEPYSPGLAIPFGAGAWHVSKNYAWNSFPNGLIDLQGKCNSGTVTIPYAGVAYPYYFLKLQNLSIDPVFENNVQYWHASYELAVCVNYDHLGNAIGWAKEIPSMGRRGYVFTDENDPDLAEAELVPYLDDAGKPIAEAQFQDAWGRRVNPLDGGSWWLDVHWEIFRPFKSVSFAGVV